jgi:choline dehydrogenase-like flavoprotein
MSEIISGATLGPNEALDCDVVVVGSGGGGAPAVYELASAGLDVVCLEAGPHIEPEQFNQRELDTIRRVYVDGGGQGPADGSLQLLQGRCIGGSTVVNGEVCFRTPDFVLEEWAGEFAVGGMSPGEMKPIFEHVEKMINVTVNEGRYLDAGRVQSEGLRKLGVEPKPIARNVKDCKGCCYCFFGCAYGCKQSMDQSYLPAALAKKARIICDAEVSRIMVSAGETRGVVADTPAGSLMVRSRAVVLACGAIATPLLLLDHKLGGDQVGRNLAVHPVAFASGIYAEAKPTHVSTMLAVYSDAWVDEGYLIEMGSGSGAFIAQGAPGFGRAHKELARLSQKVWAGGSVTRDRTAPGRVRRDRKGRKVIDYKLDGPTRERVRAGMKRSAEIHFAGGADKVYLPFTEPVILETADEIRRLDDIRLGPADVTLVSYHPQGTARLGTVTDNDGQVNGARSLYVMDTSLFPTPVGVNPQVSVMAVATMLARRLARRLGTT